MPDLDALLRAKSVAVIGASPKPDSFGWHVLRQLLDFGYAGRIVPVNPGYEVIEGLPCYPSVGSAPGPIDCAAICLADERVEAALLDAVEAGVRAAVVFGVAAGEAASGKPLRDRICEIASETELALMGANCMGFFNFVDRLFLTGYPYHREPVVRCDLVHHAQRLDAVCGGQEHARDELQLCDLARSGVGFDRGTLPRLCPPPAGDACRWAFPRGYP